MNAKSIVPAGIRRFVRDTAEVVVFGAPRPFRPDLELSSQARGWLKALSDDGIVKIEGESDFRAVADHVDSAYFEPIEEHPERFLDGGQSTVLLPDRNLFVRNVNKDDYRKGGTQISCMVSFLDPACAPLYVNQDLIHLLYKYYGRQPYYRNQPLIEKSAFRSGQQPLGNGSFHVDHLHQISLMLLVVDVTERQTHMEYCIGSHKRHLLREGVELPLDQCKARAGDYPIFECTGAKGTLFVFDTSGFHRANYVADSTRKILHLNVTTGHHLATFVDRRAPASAAGQSRYVRSMFRHVSHD